MSLNDFEQFVLDNKDKKWEWYYLSQNPNISLQFIISNPKLPWDWSGLSGNINLDVETIISHPNLDWDFSELQSNNNLTFKDIKKIQEYFDFEIDYSELSSNKNITDDNIYDEGIDKDWDYESLMVENKNISLDCYIEMYDLDLIDDEFYNFLSMSNCLNATYVFDNIDKDWDWFQISKNISLKDIKAFFTIAPWDERALSCNPNVNIEFVKNHLDIDWDWSRLSINKGIKIQDIFNNLDLPWDWTAIMRNPNLKLNDIKQHPDILKLPSSNKNLTIEYIKNNLELKWDYTQLSMNKFNYKKKNKSAKIIQKFYKKYKLRQLYFGWIEIIEIERMNPDSKYFKKLIENMFIQN